MIHIKKGTLMYEETTILSQLDLRIEKGECVVLCGESGSGKSSLIRVLNGLIPELYEGVVKGEIKVLGEELPVKNFNQYVKGIGVVFQNPKTQFFMNDVYSELAFSMENYGYSREVMKNRVKQVSKEFNVAKYWKSTMFQLSGGQKQQIAFASACMLHHDLFLLDEPSSNLDEKHIDLVTNYLMWLKKEQQTIIIAEHRLHYLLPIADRFILMKNGQIIGDYTKEELENYSDDEINKLGLRTLSKPELTVPTGTNKEVSITTGNQLRCENITFSYKNKSDILKINELVFCSNKVVGLIGDNGAGKTTLSHLLTGLLKPKKGTIYYNGEKQSAKELIKKSFLVMQDVNFQLFFENVKKEITARARRMELYETVVATLKLTSLLTRHPQTLSGGEKQRVAIASAILSGKEILILDEPTSGLDLLHMLEVSQMINKLSKFDILLIIVSHDNEFINLTCQQVIRMNKGLIS